MTTKDIIETYTDPRGMMTDYTIECEKHVGLGAAVRIRLVPKRPRDPPLEGAGTFRNNKIIDRSGKVSGDVFDWAEKVIIARRRLP
jgi:hypothetical protein